MVKFSYYWDNKGNALDWNIEFLLLSLCVDITEVPNPTPNPHGIKGDWVDNTVSYKLPKEINSSYR